MKPEFRLLLKEVTDIFNTLGKDIVIERRW